MKDLINEIINSNDVDIVKVEPSYYELAVWIGANTSHGTLNLEVFFDPFAHTISSSTIMFAHNFKDDIEINFDINEVKDTAFYSNVFALIKSHIKDLSLYSDNEVQYTYENGRITLEHDFLSYKESDEHNEHYSYKLDKHTGFVDLRDIQELQNYESDTDKLNALITNQELLKSIYDELIYIEDNEITKGYKLADGISEPQIDITQIYSIQKFANDVKQSLGKDYFYSKR